MSDTSSPRIAAASPLTPEQQELLAATLVRDGEPLNIFATLARHPRLLKRFNVLGGFFLTRGVLPSRERELVILRVASRTNCEYEFGQHVLIGQEAGLTEGEIWQVTQPDVPGPWLETDAALLQFTDELIDTTDVTDATWNEAARRLDEQQLLELVCLIGFYRMVAGLLNGVRIDREDAIPGWPQHPDST